MEVLPISYMQLSLLLASQGPEEKASHELYIQWSPPPPPLCFRITSVLTLCAARHIKLTLLANWIQLCGGVNGPAEDWQFTRSRGGND